MSTLTESMIINIVVLAAVLESDLGPHRKIGWFRIVRPLLMAGAIVPLFLDAPATRGTGLTIEMAGVAAGALLGVLATALMTVYRSPRTNKPVSGAGVGYAAVWVAAIGARAAFSWGSAHWFTSSLTTWMGQHQLTEAALTDGLIFMAIAMVLTRTSFLAARASSTAHPATAAVA